jgi:anti-anti-sigma factor
VLSATAPRSPDLLSVTALPGDRPGCVVVEVSGQVDPSTAPLLHACLATQSGRRGVQELVVDLQQVTHLAEAGVAALAWAQRRCRLRGARFALRCGGRRSVLRLLQPSGLSEVVTVAQPDDDGHQPGDRPSAARSTERTPGRRRRPRRAAGARWS